MRTEQEIKQAIRDSEKYFKEKFPEMKLKKGYLNLNNRIDTQRSIESLAVANEICTLGWVLGEGKLNCYGGKK